MIDLINKTSDEINALIVKYTPVLELFAEHYQNQIPYLAYIIDTCVNHINEKHLKLPIDWKTWSVLVVKNQYLDDKIKTIDEVVSIIDDFVTFYDIEYTNYCNDIIAATEFDRDRGFTFKYLRQ